MALNYGIAYNLNGERYRADPGKKYGDGGIDYNVRKITHCKHDKVFVEGQVTRFYRKKDGTCRASDPKKSKTNWKYDTPASQWEDWEPHAKAWLAELNKVRKAQSDKRKSDKRIIAMRNGRRTYVERNNATPKEIKAYEEGKI